MSFRFDVGRAGDPAYMYVAMRESHRGNLSVFDRSVYNFASSNVDFDPTIRLIDNVEDIRELLVRIFDNFSCHSYIKYEVRDELDRIDDWIAAIEYEDSNDSSAICPLIREFEQLGRL